MIVGIILNNYSRPTVDYQYDRYLLLSKDLLNLNFINSIFEDLISKKYSFWDPIEFRSGNSTLETQIVTLFSQQEQLYRLRSDCSAIINFDFDDKFIYRKEKIRTISDFTILDSNNRYLQIELCNRRNI